MKTKMVEIILKHMAIYFEPDPDCGPIAFGAAEEICKLMPEFQDIDKLLTANSIMLAALQNISANAAEYTEWIRCNANDAIAIATRLNPEPETSISIGDTIQSIDCGWIGRVDAFEGHDGVTMIVCFHYVGEHKELDDKRWFDPRDVRLIQKGVVEEPFKLQCDLCGNLDDEADAIDSGWIPSYWKGETEINEPVCSECVKTRIRPRWGEAVLIEETITTIHEEPAQPGTLKEFVDRLRALTEEHDRLENEYDDRTSSITDEQINLEQLDIYEQCFAIAKEIVNLNPSV